MGLVLRNEIPFLDTVATTIRSFADRNNLAIGEGSRHDGYSVLAPISGNFPDWWLYNLKVPYTSIFIDPCRIKRSVVLFVQANDSRPRGFLRMTADFFGPNPTQTVRLNAEADAKEKLETLLGLACERLDWKKKKKN